MKTPALILIALLLVGSASAVELFTSHVYTQQEVRSILTGLGVPADRLPNFAGTHYAQVARAGFPEFHALTRYRISREYGPRWNDRLNCYGLCWEFVSAATKRVANDKFQVPLPAPKASERAGLLVFSFVRKDGNGMHSALLLFTDEGPVWWDPQSGLIDALTPAEIASVVWFQ